MMFLKTLEQMTGISPNGNRCSIFLDLNDAGDNPWWMKTHHPEAFFCCLQSIVEPTWMHLLIQVAFVQTCFHRLVKGKNSGENMKTIYGFLQIFPLANPSNVQKSCTFCPSLRRQKPQRLCRERLSCTDIVEKKAVPAIGGFLSHEGTLNHRRGSIGNHPAIGIYDIPSWLRNPQMSGLDFQNRVWAPQNLMANHRSTHEWRVLCHRLGGIPPISDTPQNHHKVILHLSHLISLWIPNDPYGTFPYQWLRLS